MFRWNKPLSWFVFLALLFLIPIFSTAQEINSNPVARVIVFHSPACPHCRIVVNEVLPELQIRYGDQLEIRLYNLMENEGYLAFAALLQALPDAPTGIPQAYVNDRVLVGSAEIPEQLPLIIDDCLQQGGCDWPFTFEPAATEIAGATIETQPVHMAFVYDPTCLECNRVRYDLDYLETQYPNLNIERYDIRQEAAFIESLCEAYGVPPELRLITPAIFVGENYIHSHEITLEHLRSLIEADNPSTAVAPRDRVKVQDLESAEAHIVERFRQFSLLAIALAGLLDGLNPCAFTTIIFFVSYLAMVGRRGREILLVGTSFTLAVFLTYLVMGLGLAELVGRLGNVSALGKIIYGVTALICLIFAVISFVDWLKIRQGKLNEIVLQLPKVLKQRIHGTIRTHSRMQGFIGAAFAAGVLVSIFELACTGQVYLPTIVFVTGISEMRWIALLALVIYNLMFVVPLIVVFLMTYWGTSSKQLTNFFENKAALVKLLTALLFGGLGIWLLVSILV